MARMHVHELRFEDAHRLEEAFRALMQVEALEDCSIEPESRSIRFLAPVDEGRKVIEKIYLGGGLQWCARHPIQPPSVRIGPAHAMGA